MTTYKIVDSGVRVFSAPSQPSACGLRKETARLFLSRQEVGNGGSLSHSLMVRSETVSPALQFNL